MHLASGSQTGSGIGHFFGHLTVADDLLLALGAVLVLGVIGLVMWAIAHSSPATSRRPPRPNPDELIPGTERWKQSEHHKDSPPFIRIAQGLPPYHPPPPENRR